MTLQDWIQENRYADSIPRRAAALGLKLLVEIAVFGVVALVVSLITQGFLNVVGFSLPGIPTTWPGLFVLFLAAGMNFAWCFTSDKP